MRYLGAHVSAAGGLENSIKNGVELGVNSIQTMFSPPMRWAMKAVEDDQIEAFVEAQRDSGVEKLLIHGIYLINLARQDKQMFHKSKVSLQNHLEAIWKIEKLSRKKGNDHFEALGVTFHPGSAKDCTPEEGVQRIAYGLDWILERVEGGMILLESSAGAGNIMGDTLEELAEMREFTEQKDRVGYVLDTQHMFVSGYDWRNDLEDIIAKIENTIGFEHLKCFHLNDSKQPFNSHKDRHENLGDGEIGMDAITALVNHPKLKDIPFILETPALKDMKTAKAEVEVLQNLSR